MWGGGGGEEKIWQRCNCILQSNCSVITFPGYSGNISVEQKHLRRCQLRGTYFVVQIHQWLRRGRRYQWSRKICKVSNCMAPILWYRSISYWDVEGDIIWLYRFCKGKWLKNTDLSYAVYRCLQKQFGVLYVEFSEHTTCVYTLPHSHLRVGVTYFLELCAWSLI